MDLKVPIACFINGLLDPLQLNNLRHQPVYWYLENGEVADGSKGLGVFFH